MYIQGQAGTPVRQTAGQPTLPTDTMGALLVSEYSPKYYNLAKQNRLFSLSALGINPSAFAGAAAGTPIFGLYNPGSVDLIMIRLGVAIRTLGTAAASASVNVYGAVQGATAPTGTQTAPRNMFSLVQSGSAAIGMVNTANTGAVASSLLRASVSLSTVATAVEFAVQLEDLIDGQVIVPPQGYVAFGLSAALTGGSIDFDLLWAELPT